MEVKILKSIFKNVKMFKDNYLEINFVNTKRVSADEVEFNEVSKAFKTTYLLNTISLVGINAVGKTTTMELLNSVLDVYIDLMDLNFNNNRVMSFMEKDKNLILENYFLIKNNIYKVVSVIKKENDNLVFVEEEIYQKSTKNVARSDVFNFDFIESPQYKRTELIENMKNL